MTEEQRFILLVVDDEEGMRMGVKRSLRNFAIRGNDANPPVVLEVKEASSGEKAIALIEEDPPDIVLLDNKMNGMTGIDVLNWINEKHLDLMTIMITAYASIETAISATKQGAYDFLPKPFTPAELKVSVKQAAKHLLAVRQARKLEREKRRVRFQFISVLAHELKAPLGAIEGYLRLLREGTSDPATHDRMVDRSLVRLSGMRKLIYDLLDLTRLESGQKKRELAAADVLDIARTAMETMKPDADPRGIAISLETNAQEIVMPVDKEEIEIVFNNLISNAVKYNRDNGKVTVAVSDKNDEVEIAVSDTGIGMTKEEMSRLFGEFVRIKNDKTKNILGSGLGLTIMRKIAALYNGNISVESTPDEGTTFTVTIPKGTHPTEVRQ
jgi:two-component system, sensor histidine kinase and response regulator